MPEPLWWYQSRFRLNSSPTWIEFAPKSIEAALKSYGKRFGCTSIQTGPFQATAMKKSRAFPNYLRMYRRRLNLTQQAVANATGLSPSQICRHERWQNVPNISVAFAYSAFYQVSVSELFQGLYDEEFTKVMPGEAAAPESRPVA